MNRSALLLPLLLAVPLAMGAKNAPDEAEVASGAKGDAQADTKADADAAKLPDFRGVWAQKLVTTAVSSVPLVGEVVSRTITYQRVQIDQQGDQLEVTAQPCDVKLVSNQSSIQTHIPRRFVESMEAQPRKAFVRHRKNGFYLLAPRRTHVLGAEMKDPDAALPKDASDPRVVDQDKDGHPGMTVRVSGLIDGRLYLIQRSWDRLWGRLIDGDKIAGRVKWHSDQVVLDSTSRWLGDPPESKPHPDPKQSYFRMIRVDDAATCSDIVARKKQLF